MGNCSRHASFSVAYNEHISRLEISVLTGLMQKKAAFHRKKVTRGALLSYILRVFNPKPHIFALAFNCEKRGLICGQNAENTVFCRRNE